MEKPVQEERDFVHPWEKLNGYIGHSLSTVLAWQFVLAKYGTVRHL